MDFSAGMANQPWAITPDRLGAILDRAGSMPAAGEISAALPRGGAIAVSNRPRSIMVLPLFGMLSQRMNPFTDLLGDTALEKFGVVFSQAVRDPSIASVVIDIDSPGGSVYGVEELAAQIFAARGRKRVVAIANSLAASAAYWIGSAAEQLSIVPSGEVGSIGIFAVHEDWSRAEEAAGIGFTLISAGKFKAEANDHQPLSDAAHAALQHRVDDYYGMFVAAVARHRGVSQSDVRDGFGQGRIVGADDALSMGMVDRVETIDQLLARLAAYPAPSERRPPAAENFGVEERRAARTRLRDAIARVGR